MNYRIINGSVSYGAETILEEIDFEINNKDKIAIVGRNGAGKSTLLKALIDNSMLEEGIGESKFSVIKEGKPKIGYLKQIEFEDDNVLMKDEILKVYKNITDLEKKIENLSNKMINNSSEKIIKEYTESLDKYQFLGGYTYKKEIDTALRKFGFNVEDEKKKISEFSGGQRTKIAFLKLLLSKPDILLLDEPTNHLDITAIEWLEKYLKNYEKAIVVVSHDRMFLDKIVNKVYEIEYGAMTLYKGNYEDFEKQKRENYEKQLKDYEYQQKEIKRLEAIVNRFKYKPTKAKMALSKLKQIEKMVKIEEPNKYDLKTFHNNFNIKQSGKDVLEVKDLSIGYNKVLQKVSFSLYRGDKLAIIGENGIGKSTLLKTLAGKIESLGGSFSYGFNISLGYFDQQLEFENEENTVFEEFNKKFPELTTTKLRTILGTFLFTGEDVDKKIKMLSGGEKSRLKLCEIFKKEPNLLMLDEPTNHMDIIGKESLENILKEYEGTLIFVSHDRYFVKKLANKILEFTKNGVTFFNGTYEEYLEYKEKNSEKVDEKSKNEKENEKYNKKENVVNSIQNNNGKINSKEQYLLNKEITRRKNKMRKIEEEIENIEKQVEELETEMQRKENITDYVKLNDLQKEKEELNKKIEDKMVEWEELNNLNEKI